MEFKAEMIELIRASAKSVREACRDLDPTETAVRQWMQQAEIDVGKRPGLTPTERDESAGLRQEVTPLLASGIRRLIDLWSEVRHKFALRTMSAFVA